MFSRSQKSLKLFLGKRMGLAAAFSLLLILTAACGGAAAPVVPTQESSIPEQPAKAIVWGKADLEPTDAIKTWQPTVDYLAAHLGDVGITQGVMKISPDSETLGQWMANGEVDIMVDSFYPAMIVSDISGAYPLAVRERGKDPKHAVFFARAEDDVKDLADFANHSIAFAEPDSTSGFMLPLAHLEEQGFETLELASADASIPSDQIGYVFAGDDDVVATWVLSGRVLAGVVDNGTFDDFEEQNPGKLSIVAETDSISSNNLVMVRQDLDPAVVDAVKKVLLGMSNDMAGQEVLKSTKTKSFTEFFEVESAAWEKTRSKYAMIKD